MTHGNFKKVISKKIKSASLSQDQLDQLNALQYNKPKRKYSNWLSMTAIIAVIAFTAVVIQQSMQTNISIEQTIGNEVAKNHIKLKPLEVKSSQIKTLRGYFKELDFLPTVSSNVDFKIQRLLGGRYCSIQGITAAQLRLKDSRSGNIQSLYQTSYDKNLFKDIPNIEKGESPVTVHSKGVAVEIWVEKGLLFAVTKD